MTTHGEWIHCRGVANEEWGVAPDAAGKGGATQLDRKYFVTNEHRWLGSRVVSVLDSGAERPGFKSQPRRCRVTVLGKLFTPIRSSSSQIGSSPLKGCVRNCRPGEK